uniref:Uncharacterized protein n=1 Tax=Megaselia scalaris TaxID=36166 RepID=T1GNN4_MEGSC
MEKISKIWLGKLPPDSPYVKPFRLFYVQNGVEKNWDLLKKNIGAFHTSQVTKLIHRRFVNGQRGFNNDL